jgi:hypothetical protein
VRRFVAEVRARQEFPLAEVAVPQHHPLGEEAEVDFGMATVIECGEVNRGRISPADRQALRSWVARFDGARTCILL